MMLSGRAPRRLNVSSTSASYRAKVSLYGRSSASSSPRRICWARMIEVTAAMAGEGPNLTSQMLAARSMGSNGSSSGLLTSITVVRRSGVRPVEQFFGGLEGVQGPGRDFCGQLVDAVRIQPGAQRGQGQRGDLLPRPLAPPALELTARAEPGPVRVQGVLQLDDPGVAQAARGDGGDDRRLPAAGLVMPERDHGAQVAHHLV